MKQASERPVRDKLSIVPRLPGVYVFKGPKEKVLYVGKAKNLRSRVGSYFQKSASLDYRKSSMVKAIRDFSFIATDNELEALVLEANLIKQYKPRYNVILRDDKNYPYLKVTLNEDWPRIEVVRRITKDGSLYFGPYVPAGSMWEALSFIRRHFNIRPCRYKLDKPMRPCIQYQMGRCAAPCAGYISKEDYRKAIDEIVRFLKGERKELIGELEVRMDRLSDEQKYEEAARIRDRIAALKRAWESQKVIAPELGDIDVIGHHTEGADTSFQVFFIRNGVMIGARDFLLKGMGSTPLKELYHGFIEMFYSKEIIPPAEILAPIKPEGSEALRKWLKEKKGGAVKISAISLRALRGAGQRGGKKAELLRMAAENAKLAMTRRRGGLGVLSELKERLGLPRVPRTIGAFDVSTISGSESVGAFIWWEDGEFGRENYRRVKIKTVPGVDDYAMMAETVNRVLGGIEPPDLIVIDGGKPHLEAALAARETLPEGRAASMISVAKDPDRAFVIHSDEPIDLEDKRPSSLLLKKIRDEAHRSAVGFHRKLRSKRLMESKLLDIKGIGKKRRLALLKHLGSMDAVRKASFEELVKVPGMDKKSAQAVVDAMKNEKGDAPAVGV